MTDDDPNTRCGNCGHEWTYSGSHELATCPSCNFKTIARNLEVDEA